MGHHSPGKLDRVDSPPSEIERNSGQHERPKGRRKKNGEPEHLRLRFRDLKPWGHESNGTKKKKTAGGKAGRIKSEN